MSAKPDYSLLVKEIKYRTARSSGAGGQHVNKTETKVELLFNPAESKVLTDKQKAIIGEKLRNRMNKDGYISVVSQEKRTQILNKGQVWRKFVKLIDKALTPVKKRKYKPVKADKESRLKEKKRRAEVKAARRKPIF